MHYNLLTEILFCNISKILILDSPSEITSKYYNPKNSLRYVYLQKYTF